MVTKKDLQFIADNYATMRNEEIAEKIGVSGGYISTIATLMRKMGVDIPAKHRVRYLDALVAEIAKEMAHLKKKST